MSIHYFMDFISVYSLAWPSYIIWRGLNCTIRDLQSKVCSYIANKNMCSVYTLLAYILLPV